MGGHGATGRKFAGRVLQLITSRTGLDDWEWGVTLFARDLKSIRDVVYEMRFDPGSAVYGLFGEFYVGLRFAPDELADAAAVTCRLALSPIATRPSAFPARAKKPHAHCQ